MTKLLPCPFCGSDKIKMRAENALDKNAEIEIFCANCDATIRGSKADAIFRWNQRVKPVTKRLKKKIDDLVGKVKVDLTKRLNSKDE